MNGFAKYRIWHLLFWPIVLLFFVLALAGCTSTSGLLDSRQPPNLTKFVIMPGGKLAGPAPLDTGFIAEASTSAKQDKGVQICIDFGDGQTACDGGIVMHRYERPGTYTATAQACYTDIDYALNLSPDCSDTQSIEINVIEPAGEIPCPKCEAKNDHIYAYLRTADVWTANRVKVFLDYRVKLSEHLELLQIDIVADEHLLNVADWHQNVWSKAQQETAPGFHSFVARDLETMQPGIVRLTVRIKTSTSDGQSFEIELSKEIEIQ